MRWDVVVLVLVLGGTVFLSRAVAREAVARGHEVVCASRGVSGTAPPGARHVRWDRDETPPGALARLSPDVVVDVGVLPSRVRRAVTTWPGAHWVYVSTISVYDTEAPGGDVVGGGPATLPLLAPIDEDADPRAAMETYGAMKVACERIVADGASGAVVVRPGLLVGPGDPSGRYTYWPERLDRAAAGEAVVAPGSPADLVQVLDVRDLAAWLVALAERRHTGTLDAVGPALPVAEVLAATARGVGAEPALRWWPRERLEAHGVQPWMGPRSLPLWLPRPELDTMMTHDAGAAADAGLRCRPIEHTARDVLAWLRETPDAVRTGLTPQEEQELLG